jgi:hypothetical protein
VKPDPEPPDERMIAIATKIVAEMRPLTGTPGEVYLRDVRKIDVVEIEDVLSRTGAIGWHPQSTSTGWATMSRRIRSMGKKSVPSSAS